MQEGILTHSTELLSNNELKASHYKQDVKIESSRKGDYIPSSLV